MLCEMTMPQSSSVLQPPSQQQPVIQVASDSVCAHESPPCCAVGGRGQSSTGRKLCFFHQCFGVATKKCGGNGCMWKNRQGNGNASCR